MSLSRTLRPALVLFTGLTMITGVAYPLVVTAIGQTVFPAAANGSLVTVNGKSVGSSLIDQTFSKPENFWSRPSTTGPEPYNAAASGGSNLGPDHPDLRKAVAERIAALRAVDPGNHQPVPVDLVTASASGLDPHISLAAAYYQVGRIAKARGITSDAIKQLIARHADTPWWGEPKVNVLELNLALAGIGHG